MRDSAVSPAALSKHAIPIPPGATSCADDTANWAFDLTTSGGSVATPEPGTFFLLASGFCGVFFWPVKRLSIEKRLAIGNHSTRRKAVAVVAGRAGGGALARCLAGHAPSRRRSCCLELKVTAAAHRGQEWSHRTDFGEAPHLHGALRDGRLRGCEIDQGLIGYACGEAR